MKKNPTKRNKKSANACRDVIRFDWAIKNLLRNKANFDVLEGFLSALLKENITILQILESEGNRNEEKMKFNRVDMMVLDSRGKKIIIEVQNDTESDYLHRLLYGTCKVVTDYMDIGKPYHEISKVISISIIYFNIQGDDYLYYGKTEFQGIHTGHSLIIKEPYIEQGMGARREFRSEEIYPEYYLIDVKKFSNIIKEDIDEWIYMFKNNKVEATFKSKNIRQAAEKLNLLNMAVNERRAYERYLMSLATERDLLDTAKREGREEGREKGREEGREEERYRVAKQAKNEGLDNDFIAKITKLSIDEILKL